MLYYCQVDRFTPSCKRENRRCVFGKGHMGEKKRTGGTHSPTLADVARKAGVSRTAVSYVLNEEQGQRNTHVSAQAREKVLQAVQELQFRPHASARALRKGFNAEIALILDHSVYPLVTEWVTAIQRQALSHGYTLVLYFCQGFSQEERQHLYQTICARRPLCILTSALDFAEREVALAHEMGVKHIIFYSFHQRALAQTTSFVIPSYALGELAARHFLARGHHHLALVQPDDEIQKESLHQRLEGMQAVLVEAPGATLELLPLNRSVSAAHSLVETWLAKAQRPTAIYAFSDEYAVLLLGAFARRGIRVPQEVAILGTDNLPVGEYVWPSLSTMDFDSVDLGKLVIEMISLLQQEQGLPEALTRPLTPRLLQREST